ncbi:hypothetical protein CJ205_00220 [Dolosicoccus paucivorans]|uniref:Transcriptional repressor n=1 Tax=Dolosicoccus paucivorans TaxID=84521 RepID=A0A2N6SQ45_9LACT|nr:Fur family transcriptional regulator [Dolosicoccus paucivorans]PMB84539.1 hypothetical protein CJ206_03360 [Dolosicoccus paucivorans]PMC59166.1 hypothetical protein CJ205_00220 [Dolosicoccus paucivorans]
MSVQPLTTPFGTDDSCGEKLANNIIRDLRNKGIRITPQRRVILEYMIQTTKHPTVEEIYQDLLPDNPGMSVATVYNNLNVLVKEGFVTEMKFSGVTSRYDFVGEHHHHIVCEKCNRISDFHFNQTNDIVDKAQSETGYKVSAAKIELYGLCPKCQLDE